MENTLFDDVKAAEVVTPVVTNTEDFSLKYIGYDRTGKYLPVGLVIDAKSFIVTKSPFEKSLIGKTYKEILDWAENWNVDLVAAKNFDPVTAAWKPVFAKKAAKTA